MSTKNHGGNRQRVERVQEIRRSNAAGKHMPKPRKGTRATTKRAALAEYR